MTPVSFDASITVHVFVHGPLSINGRSDGERKLSILDYQDYCAILCWRYS